VTEKDIHYRANKPLIMWVVYDHPHDVPDAWVARCWLVRAGEVRPTVQTFEDIDLDQLRLRFRQAGYTRIKRHESDDPKIVEVWL